MPYQPPSTNMPSIINIPPPPIETYEYNRVPYNYEEGVGESYPNLSTEEVANLVGLITRSGRITEPAITNLRQDSTCEGKARLESREDRTTREKNKNQ